MVDQTNGRGALDTIESALTGLPEPISVDLDAKPDDVNKGKAAAATPTAPPAKAAEDENVVALRRQLEAQKRETAVAQARAREIEARRAQAEAQSAEGQLRLITTELQNATAVRERAKADLTAAMAAGDWARASDVQVHLNDAQIRVDQFTRGQSAMEQRAAAEIADRERAAQHQPHNNDPLETLAASLSPRSAAWIRANPECATDPRRNRLMVRAHEDAIDDGIEIDTPEYFAAIEERLGIGKQEGGERQQERKPPPAARRDVAAPVSRGDASAGRGSRENTVTLSPSQRAFCDDSGTTYEAYAKNLVALRKEGRLK